MSDQNCNYFENVVTFLEYVSIAHIYNNNNIEQFLIKLHVPSVIAICNTMQILSVHIHSPDLFFTITSLKEEECGSVVGFAVILMGSIETVGCGFHFKHRNPRTLPI
jgi:hypothetical protein